MRGQQGRPAVRKMSCRGVVAPCEITPPSLALRPIRCTRFYRRRDTPAALWSFYFRGWEACWVQYEQRPHAGVQDAYGQLKELRDIMFVQKKKKKVSVSEFRFLHLLAFNVL